MGKRKWFAQVCGHINKLFFGCFWFPLNLRKNMIHFFARNSDQLWMFTLHFIQIGSAEWAQGFLRKQYWLESYQLSLHIDTFN